jgi:hypothetical protein
MRAAKNRLASAEAVYNAKNAALRAAVAETKPPPAPPPTVAVPADLQKKLDDVNAQINVRLAELKKKSADGGGVDTAAIGGVSEAAEYERLGRTVRLARETYSERKVDLDKARLAVNVASASAGDSLTVLDPAYLPMTPSKGGRSKTAMMGGAVALIVAILYAIARVLFNDTLIDQADVEALRLIPVLGVLPRIGSPGSGKSLAKGGPPGAV